MMLRWLKSHRIWWMGVAPVVVLAWFLGTDPDGGLQLSGQLQAMVSPFLALAFAYLGRKAILAGDSKSAWARAMAGDIAGAILVLAVAILTAALFLGFAPRAMAAPVPAGAVKYLPVLAEEVDAHWPGMPMRSVLAAQVEQESQWKVQAELKTSREYGFGLGQFTRAYTAAGAVRFDAWAETRAMDGSLAGWTWANRFDPRMQLRALTIKNRLTYRKVRPLLDDDYDALAMMDAAYNCGLGCVQARRRLCGQVAGCDPDRWFGHAERYSTQSKVKWKGYGLSAHDITVQHVRNVMVVRRAKYAGFDRA